MRVRQKDWCVWMVTRPRLEAAGRLHRPVLAPLESSVAMVIGLSLALPGVPLYQLRHLKGHTQMTSFTQNAS